MTFAIRRQAQNLTQEDVACKLGVDRSSVSKWETGECLPRAETLIKLSQLYKCTVDDLLQGSDESA